MTDTTDSTVRLLRLLTLLQQHAVWTGPELADRLDVSVRGVRRDISRLRELGYPVHSERGLGGGYRLAPGKAMPPLVLDDEEAVAVAVSLSLAAGGTVAGIEDEAMRALAKLDQVVPQRLRERIDAVRAATVTVGAGDDSRRLGDPHRGGAGLPGQPPAAVLLPAGALGGGRGAGGRAVSPRRDGPPLVPHGVGSRPRRLADLPARPDERAARDDMAIHAA